MLNVAELRLLDIGMRIRILKLYMEIHTFSEKDTSRWERFIAESNNGTIFHTQRFLSYHPKNRFIHHHCMFQEKGSLLGIFPAVEHENTIISHRGASYGGIVLKNSVGIHTVCLMVDHLVSYCKDRGFKKIILTQTPLIYYQSPHQYVDFALAKNGFSFIKREVTAAIPIKSADPLGMFHADARRSTKKAIREGVHVRISDDFRVFYTILENNLGMRHNVSPTHTIDELLRLKKLFPDDILLFAAYLNKTMIGGVVIFITNSSTVLAFYISHNNEYQSYRPVNLLFYEILKWGKLKGYHYLDLGTFTLHMEPNWGLGRFKENHNAHGFLRDTYELMV